MQKLCLPQAFKNIIVHVLVFQRNQKFRVIFLGYLQYLKVKYFWDHKLWRNLFLRLRHEKKNYFVELIFAIFFFSFFLLQKFYIVFYSNYVSICKDLQKTIVLSSGPFLQVFTFTIQCICNL